MERREEKEMRKIAAQRGGRYGIATYGTSRFEVQDLKEGRKVCTTDTREEAEQIIETLENKQTWRR